MERFRDSMDDKAIFDKDTSNVLAGMTERLRAPLGSLGVSKLGLGTA